MEMMLPSELSLPFFSAITDKVCFQRSTKADLQKRTSLLSLPLMHALVLWGKSQTGQFTRVRFLETRAGNSPAFIRY